MADLQQNNPSIFNWYLVFRPVGPHRPILHFFDCHHVTAICKMNNLAMVIDPMMGAVNITITEQRIGQILAMSKHEEYDILHFAHAPDITNFKLRSPFMTCAGYIAYTIGIGFFGVTAGQLKRRLLRMGASYV